MLFKTDEKARAQHTAVRENIGWYRWTHDLVEVSGADSTSFLDYLYVNSIAKAPVGRTKYTTMLNENGKIIDDVIVMHMEEDLYWVSTLYAPKLMPWIDAHKGARSVEYKDLTYEVDMYAVQGPNSLAMMNKLLQTPIDELKRFAVEDNKIGNIAVKVHRSGFTGELGYEIYCDIGDTKAVEEAIRNAGKEFGATEMTILEVYVRSLPMEKGFSLRQDMYGLTPYEAELGWSVDMSKDFIGKAALEKANEEGAVQKLVGLELLAESYEDINQSERIRRRGRDIGLVRACIYGYTVDKNIGFAVVDAKYAVPGTQVEIGCNNSPAVICEKQWT
ncbi:aminomethyltransferase family protein [Clostridia bacterium OttesenSCG-928-O13]|nr:aminomethyltransferase family protein [Clostridia bacterium OttesenSCG-928-O13]